MTIKTTGRAMWVVVPIVAAALSVACVRESRQVDPAFEASWGLTEDDYPAAIRGRELAGLIKHHVLGQPNNVRFYTLAGLEEVYRVEIDAPTVNGGKLFLVAMRSQGQRRLSARRVGSEWFGRAEECIAQWYVMFREHCALPAAGERREIELSLGEWQLLQASFDAAGLWASSEQSDCPGLDGVWISVDALRGGAEVASALWCDDRSGPVGRLMRELAHLSTLDFPLPPE